MMPPETNGTVEEAEAPLAEFSVEDMIATIGELEIGRRALLGVANRLRVENAALKARVEHLEAEHELVATAHREE